MAIKSFINAIFSDHFLSIIVSSLIVASGLIGGIGVYFKRSKKWM